ncbi:MAG: ParB/RepB/Spo0J family partition protein [Candidatus Kapaibacterium sp.]
MSKKSKKIQPGLGKGLGALLPSIDYNKEKGFSVKQSGEDRFESGSIALIDIDKVEFNPYQPRKDFDKQALEDLKNSILQHGVIQPITVRRAIRGYELVAGERRLRASRKAGLEKIPAFIMEISDDVEMLEIALIENVQRENLNPIEIANGYHRLIEECRLTQEEVAAKVGKDRSSVTNFLRLLRLPERIQEGLRNREISMGHARALLALKNQRDMLHAFNDIIEKKLSVRATEALTKDIESGKVKYTDRGQREKTALRAKPIIDEQTALVLEDSADRLRHSFGTKVKINPKSKESGTIEFEFYSKDDLERLLEIFAKLDKINS